jgi:hypothetical protein
MVLTDEELNEFEDDEHDDENNKYDVTSRNDIRKKSTLISKFTTKKQKLVSGANDDEEYDKPKGQVNKTSSISKSGGKPVKRNVVNLTDTDSDKEADEEKQSLNIINKGNENKSEFTVDVVKYLLHCSSTTTSTATSNASTFLSPQSKKPVLQPKLSQDALKVCAEFVNIFVTGKLNT